MKYYSLNTNIYECSFGQTKFAPLLRGDKINKGKELFINRKIWHTNYVNEAPVFDYFEMMDGGNFKKTDDWINLDCYNFIGYKVPVSGICISLKFKDILDKFELIQPTKFYPCKVMFKGTKLDYFILHCAVDIMDEIFFNQSKAVLNNAISNEFIEVFYLPKSQNEFRDLELINLKKSLRVVITKYHLKTFSDLIPFNPYAISERLKNAIEEAGITGVKMEPIDDITFEFENGIPELL